MRFVRSRSTACAAALAYLLAAALSGLLHDHEHESASFEQIAGHTHAGDLVGLPAREASDHAEGGTSLPPPVSDDDCAACRFVTQSAVVVVAAPATGLTPLVAELRVAAPHFFIEPIRVRGLARAPPMG